MTESLVVRKDGGGTATALLGTGVMTDKLHYVRIPKGHGGRAEQARLTYVLAGKAYEDVLHTFAEAGSAVAGKNPFKQFPFVETPDGKCLFQTLAIMHHVGHGTPAWPSSPAALTEALSVAMGGYDLYQSFGAFAADDLAAKKRFEERRAPQFFGGLAEIYGKRLFATGSTATFADVFVHEAVAWCVRRNDVCKGLYEASPSLVAFMDRFRAIPAVAEFMKRQALAREKDDSV
jgi:glutathione S-transferase